MYFITNVIFWIVSRQGNVLAFAEEFNIIMVIIDPKPLMLWAPYNFLGAQPCTCTYHTVLPFSNLQGKGNFGDFKKKEVTLQTEPGRSVL